MVFIDGNHAYEYVKSDLKNAARVATRLVILDDYVMSKHSKKILFCPWNEGVVRAVDHFLERNKKIFKNAYWIKDTKYAVLIK